MRFCLFCILFLSLGTFQSFAQTNEPAMSPEYREQLRKAVVETLSQLQKSDYTNFQESLRSEQKLQNGATVTNSDGKITIILPKSMLEARKRDAKERRVYASAVLKKCATKKMDAESIEKANRCFDQEVRSILPIYDVQTVLVEIEDESTGQTNKTIMKVVDPSKPALQEAKVKMSPENIKLIGYATRDAYGRNGQGQYDSFKSAFENLAKKWE